MAAGTEWNGIDRAPQNFNSLLLVCLRTCDFGLRLEKLEVENKASKAQDLEAEDWENEDSRAEDLEAED